MADGSQGLALAAIEDSDVLLPETHHWRIPNSHIGFNSY